MYLLSWSIVKTWQNQQNCWPPQTQHLNKVYLYSHMKGEPVFDEMLIDIGMERKGGLVKGSIVFPFQYR